MQNNSNNEEFEKLKKEIEVLEKTVSERDEEIEKLTSISLQDFLTLLYNRHGFMLEAGKVLEEMGKMSKDKVEKRKIIFEDFSLIFIDMDDLKKINDVHGHSEGDNALKAMAEIFKLSVRKFDIVARWGGDEFIIGLLGADVNRAFEIAENIREKLQSVVIKGQKLSASFGITDIADDSIENEGDIIQLIERADAAMYKAKKELGKNTIVVYDNEKETYEQKTV